MNGVTEFNHPRGRRPIQMKDRNEEKTKGKKDFATVLKELNCGRTNVKKKLDSAGFEPLTHGS